MQKNTRYSFRWCVLRTSYSPPPRPSTKGLPTGQFHWTVRTSLPISFETSFQLAQPLAHGLMVNVGAVERAAEPRTLGRATGHEPECTYLGTDVKGCRGPDPSPQCLHDRGGFLGSERTHAESLLPEKPPAVRNFAGKRVRRRGLVSLQSYTFK